MAVSCWSCRRKAKCPTWYCAMTWKPGDLNCFHSPHPTDFHWPPRMCRPLPRATGKPQWARRTVSALAQLRFPLRNKNSHTQHMCTSKSIPELHWLIPEFVRCEPETLRIAESFGVHFVKNTYDDIGSEEWTECDFMFYCSPMKNHRHQLRYNPKSSQGSAETESFSDITLLTLSGPARKLERWSINNVVPVCFKIPNICFVNKAYKT